MSDYVSRDALVTVTMSAEEWDGVRDRGYVDWRVQSKAREYIDAAIGPFDQRRDQARLEAEAQLPPLTPKVRRYLARLVKILIKQREDGSLVADHLGHSAWLQALDGWGVRCVPRTDSDGGWPNMHFTRTAVWFDHRELPMTETETEILRKLVSREREVVDVWGGGSWLSVTWRLR